MITRVHIKGYKSLKEAEVYLRPLTVLFGPNAVGKSNFLDALQLLSRIVTSRNLNEAFEPPYRGEPLESFTFGPEGIKSIRRRRNSRLSIEVDVALSEGVIDRVTRNIRIMRTVNTDAQPADTRTYIIEKFLRYRIEIEIDPEYGFLRVVDEFCAPLRGNGQIKQSRNPFIERMGKRLHLRMEGQAHPQYHDLHLDHTLLSTPLYPPHYPHLTALREELANWRFYYFEPRERMRAASPLRETSNIGLMGEDLAAYLNTLKRINPKQYQHLQKTVTKVIPSISGLEVEVNDFGQVEFYIREGNSLIPASVVSEGTLRVVGLLALQSFDTPATLVGFEEPENGVQPQRIQLIAEIIKTYALYLKTQIVVTSHSPSFLDAMPSESLFLCKKIDHETVITPLTAVAPLWQQSEIDAGLIEEGTPLSVRLLRGDYGD